MMVKTNGYLYSCSPVSRRDPPAGRRRCSIRPVARRNWPRFEDALAEGHQRLCPGPQGDLDLVSAPSPRGNGSQTKVKTSFLLRTISAIGPACHDISSPSIARRPKRHDPPAYVGPHFRRSGGCAAPSTFILPGSMNAWNTGRPGHRAAVIVSTRCQCAASGHRFLSVSTPFSWAIFLSFRVQAAQMLCQAIEAFFPVAAIEIEPVGGVLQRPGGEFAGAPLRSRPASMRPARSNTFRCFETPGPVIWKGSANSFHRRLAERQPRPGSPAASDRPAPKTDRSIDPVPCQNKPYGYITIWLDTLTKPIVKRRRRRPGFHSHPIESVPARHAHPSRPNPGVLGSDSVRSVDIFLNKQK